MPFKYLHLSNMGSESSDKKLPVGGTPEVKTNLPKFKAKINLEGHGGIRNGLCQLPRHINITIIVLIEFQMGLY